jgi:serine/threonine-protein kinase
MGKITASQFKLTVPDAGVADAVDSGWGEAPTSVDSADQTLSDATENLACPECGVVFSSPDATFCPFDGARLLRATSPQQSDPLLGQVLAGRYQVQGLLGEGGMGAVYRVTHTTLGKQFAVKVLRSDLARDAELSQRFMREARAMARINNPNVIQVTDFGELDDGRPFFVMELLTGRSLSTLLRERSVSPSAALVIARRVAEALAAAHSSGIIHRDLKPDNVSVEPGSLQVKVLDFGLAYIVGSSRLTQRGVVFGTPQYMSPEQASGGAVDHRADIYALGIVLYEMLAGKVPFEADSYMGVLTKQLYAPPAPLPAMMLEPDATRGALEPGLDREIDALVQRCLAKKAEERFSSMQEVVAVLDDVMRRVPSSARAPSQAPTVTTALARRGSRATVWFWWLVAGAFLIGMGLWGWYTSVPELQKVPLPQSPAGLAVSPSSLPERPVVRPLQESPAVASVSSVSSATAPKPPVPRDPPAKSAVRARPAAKPSPKAAPPSDQRAAPAPKPTAPLSNTDLIDPWSQQ